MSALTTSSHDPEGWSDAELTPWPKPRSPDERPIANAVAQLHGPGWAVIDVVDGSLAQTPDAAQLASAVFGTLGRPIRIFANLPLWKVLRSDPRRPLGSSGGVGAQEPHIDFVNAALPPDLVALFCIRADPAGGGASVVSSTGAVAALPAQTLAALAQPIYRDGRVEGLDNVGADINPFPVWNPGDALEVRWTGKLLESTADPAPRAALSRLGAALTHGVEEVALAPGQLLVINQRRAVHGRRALGAGQDRFPPDQRRLFMHGFARWE
jgi:Taurine catabolism dioxygenase TauD, TfdA family